MLDLLWTIPAFPLLGFLILALGGGWLSARGVAAVGVGSVALSALAAFIVGIGFLASPPAGHAYTQVLWQWMSIADFAPQAALYLDPLSLVMVSVITFVGFLIHLYSAEFMSGDEGYRRFFAYMNLFVAAMLTLVLADNLLLLYLGWEGVGLCSYLLIGFWYRDGANGLAARKAFVVTRVGDTAMAIGLFLLFSQLGTLEIQPLMRLAAEQWPPGSGLAMVAAALLLGGALGKSAQLPLQTWLPDAMAGPTPVSALIHAATMVTAGVYLVARTHALFALAPAVMSAVAAIGTLTLLLAGFAALAQSDIKRVLAYSTVSQIGYMFLALGVGAWPAAIFHFMTHAFFKALLFLGAGAVTASLDHEHDIFRMGGLRPHLPLAFWTFLIGSASLAALPLATAGFYSKDAILWAAWSSPQGGPWLWAGGWLGAFLTGLYIFRLLFHVFFGELKTVCVNRAGQAMNIPLVVLAFLSLTAGFMELPRNWADFSPFSQFLLPVFAAAPAGAGHEMVMQLLASAASLAGVVLAYLLFLRRSSWLAQKMQTPAAAALHRFWRSGGGFDWLYDRLLVRPFLWLARINCADFIDAFYNGVAWLCRLGHRLLSRSQTGQVRWYAAGVTAGSIVVTAMAVWL
ncbi:MAG: NADH-quinone oxidoreductase subunit L [Sulfuricella sp.]|nr:NADH-quinone oxidoreductase subunit L [Sulfuricella sp.]